MEKEKNYLSLNEGEILERVVKKRARKKIVLVIFSVFIASLLAIGFGIFLGYLFSPEKQLNIGAEIESVFLSEDGNNIYIKLFGGSNEKNITGVKFIFKDSEGKEYFYETQEGVEKIGKPYETSWINIFKKPDYDGVYDYNISLNKITDLESFENLGNISVIFIYENKKGVEIETPPLDDTTNPITPSNNGGGGGSHLPASCQQKSCFELGFKCEIQIDNCGNNIDCGVCSEGFECIDGICLINQTNLIAYYKFEGNANDETGDNQGTLIGDASIIYNTERGDVLSLNGDKDYVKFSKKTYDLETKNYTFSFWTELTEDSIGQNTVFGDSSMIGKYSNYIAIYCAEGLCRVQIEATTNSEYCTTDYTDKFNNGWHHTIITFNNYECKVYINGESLPIITNNLNSDLDLDMIGIAGYDYRNDFKGTIDEVMIFDKSLTANEISEIYNIFKECIPSCAGKECGVDGWGRSCGSCLEDYRCSNGQCTKIVPTCNNGFIEDGETCDDGNLENGDGCSSSCQTENGWICSGEPSGCSALRWHKVNDGNPIDGYEPIYHLSWLSSTVESILVEDGLIYLFDSETLGKVTGRLTNGKKWELLTDDGWSNSEEIIPKPVSIFDFTREMELFKFPSPDNRIFGIYNFGFGGIRTGILQQDTHGGVFNFIFDGNEWLKWADVDGYTERIAKGVIQSWGGIDSDFAFNGQDSGILIGDYGYSLGDRYSRLIALKYYKNSEESPTGKNWELWDGNGWGGYHTSYSTYVSIPEVIPWSELDNTPFENPEIAFLGNNEYLTVFEYNDRVKALLYKDEEPYVWKWWDGTNWQEGGDYDYANISNEIPKSYSYEMNILNKENNALIFIKPAYQNLYEIIYDSVFQTFNNGLIISDIDYYAVAKDNSNNIWLTFSNESGIFIMKKTSTEWSSPELVYSGTGTEVKNINFIEGVPIIFFAEDDRLYALSDHSSDFWNEETISIREQKPETSIAVSSKIEFVEKWSDYVDGINYGAETTGHPALDNEGILYSPHVEVCNVAIFNTSNIEQKNYWGGFWKYFHFPSGVDIDNIREKVYISNYLTTGGSGGLPSGNIRIWDKNLNSQTFTDGDNNAGVITLYSNFKFPSDVAVDEENGYLYVSDSMNNKIQKFDIINLDAGNKPTKITDIENDFSFPQGIDLDSQGNLYVVDTGNHKIQKLDSQGNFILEFGTQGFGTGEFILPYAISIDPITNVIYVSDPYKKEIQMFSDSGNFIYKFGKWQEETLQSFDKLSGIVAYNNILYVGADDYLIKFEIKDITPLPEYCIDLDKDGYYTGGTECGLDDCDDSNNDIHPNAEEKCDLIDWDCDGEYNDAPFKIDDCPEVGERVGICENSERTCLEDGTWSSCSIEPIIETYETCDMIDDNCDGETWFFDEDGCSEEEIGICTRMENYDCFVQKDWTLCPGGLDSECEDFDDCTEDVCLNGECVFTKFETIEECYYCVNETLSSLEDPLVGGLDVNHDGILDYSDRDLLNEYYLFTCDESNYYCNYRDVNRKGIITFSDMINYFNLITQNDGAECKIEEGTLRSVSLTARIINFFKNLYN